MTISSPVGTVNEYTFTTTDTLLNGVSTGLGSLTSWTLPRHDGAVAALCVWLQVVGFVHYVKGLADYLIPASEETALASAATGTAITYSTSTSPAQHDKLDEVYDFDELEAWLLQAIPPSPPRYVFYDGYLVPDPASYVFYDGDLIEF